eukprot:TRINITY_DN8370_c0_g1::TRINITY_DN8370_c0_g1_i1::g.29082::m.29082 TRINITY_DN8370_c0_g1::TRINITY_DN8370_c0_g1_i1::g.29082  ORF type:complete len:243 (+),score=51.19,sp/Q9UKD2/MRT4_HUMAN/51.13/2e-75,Ribosomal_L10/PF00466.15/2.2e-18,RNase_H_2/PF13482.1/0.016,RNase_H_2/PF13482.1/3.6e+03 TRINITY_DN8370_c0_g1_i1:43-771(+)
MPKNKRSKIIPLTKTIKKSHQIKQKLIEKIHEGVENYKNIFVFSYGNLPNSKLKEVRDTWKDSRFFLGKNKVMARALGLDESEEHKEGLRQIAKLLKGNRGLLLTNRPKSDVVSWFENYCETDYARSGYVASETVELPEGPLDDQPHSLETTFRKLGMPTALKNGVIVLRKDFTVCRIGEALTPEQARILKHLNKPMAEFRIKLHAVWSEGGEFETLAEDDDEDENAMEADANDMSGSDGES